MAYETYFPENLDDYGSSPEFRFLDWALNYSQPNEMTPASFEPQAVAAPSMGETVRDAMTGRGSDRGAPATMEIDDPSPTQVGRGLQTMADLAGIGPAPAIMGGIGGLIGGPPGAGIGLGLGIMGGLVRGPMAQVMGLDPTTAGWRDILGSLFGADPPDMGPPGHLGIAGLAGTTPMGAFAPDPVNAAQLARAGSGGREVRGGGRGGDPVGGAPASGGSPSFGGGGVGSGIGGAPGDDDY